MINHIQFDNIKNRSGSYHNLGSVVLVLGDNASGKTAVLDAITFGMVGYSPKLRSPAAKGVPNAEMFKLCSSSHMAVRMVTDQGINIRRIDQRRGKDGPEYSKSEDAPAVFAPIIIDSALYFSLSAAARVKLVASLVKMDDAPGFSVPEILAGVKNVKIEENTKSSEEAILRCYAVLSKQAKAVALDWLALGISNTNESLTLAKRTRQTMVAVGIGITQLQSQDADQSAAGSAAESKLKVARTALGALQTAVGNEEADVAATKKLQQRRADLQQVTKPDVNEERLKLSRDNAAVMVAVAKKKIAARHVTTEQQFGLLTKVTTEKHAAVNEGGRIKRLQDAALTRKKPEGIDEIALTARRTALLESVAKLQTLASSRAFSTIETAATVEQYKRDKLEQLTIYNSAKEQIATLSAETTKFLSCAQCPTCLATGTDWQAPWKREQDTKVTRLQQKLDVATIEGTRLKKLIEVTELLLTQMRGQDLELQNFTKDAADIELLLAQNKTALDAHSAAVTELEQLNAEMDNNGKLVISLDTIVEAAQKLYDDLKIEDGALATLVTCYDDAAASVTAAGELLQLWKLAQADLKTIPVQDIPAAEAALARTMQAVVTKQQEIRTLEDQCKSVNLARADLKRQMEAVTASEAAQSEVEVLKAVKTLLEDKQASLVSTAFGALLATANRFCSVILKAPLEYRDEIGYVADGSWVSASTFSGAEEAVLFVGLCCALASASAGQKVVIIDEMSRFDNKNKAALLVRLLELVDTGIIEQAVLVDVDGTAYKSVKDARISVIEV